MSIHFDDYGTVFHVVCLDGSDILDVSAALSRELYLQKPNSGAVLGPLTLSLENDGVDGKVKYVFPDGTIDTVGEWTWQAKLTWASGRNWADQGKFTVYGNLA